MATIEMSIADWLHEHPELFLDHTPGPFAVYQWDRGNVWCTLCHTLGDARGFIEQEIVRIQKSLLWINDIVEIEINQDCTMERYNFGNGVHYSIDLATDMVPRGLWVAPSAPDKARHVGTGLVEAV
jgi:hypothetical protein